MSAILLLNGPNLGILGQREPEVYGTDTLADIERAVGEEVAGMGWKVISFQSDSEETWSVRCTPTTPLWARS